MSHDCNACARASRPAEPDRVLLQHLVDRRLALRLGLSLPVAALLAQLAGLGPRGDRR